MTHKFCPDCKIEKPISEFHIRRYYTGCPARTYCKICKKNRASIYYKKNKARVDAKNKLWGLKNLDRRRRTVRAWHYKNYYGISEEEKRMMELAQNNRCKICNKLFSEIPQNRVHIDHCHATGKIRGVLCHNCNQVIGQAKDKVEILKSAINYLLEFDKKLKKVNFTSA